MKRIFVIGGAGFIGSHTVDLLLEEGREVVVFDNLSTGKLSYLNLFNPKLRFVQGDILDYALLRKEMATCDAVLHLAAISSISESIENPIQSLKVNSLGFVHVLQAIRENYKPLRLVYASSAAVYGHAEKLPCSDEQPLASHLLSPYALEKMNNEHYADLFSRLFGINSVGLRYFNVYGARQDPKSPYSGVISKFIEQYRKKEAVTIFGDGEQSRDFVHVSDVARANVLALYSNYQGILNIATGIPHTIKDLVQYLEMISGTKVAVDYEKPRSGDIYKSYASLTKAETHLQYRALMTLENGIQKIFNEV